MNEQLRKKLFIITGTIVVIVLIVIYLFLTFPIGKPEQNKPSTQPFPTRFETSPVPTIFVPDTPTIDVSGVEINNILQNPIQRNETGDTMFGQTQDYQLVYLPSYKQFLITVLGTPFDQARTRAEQAFLEYLGITQEDACELTVYVSTPSFANPDESGVTYPLSFCEN